MCEGNTTLGPRTANPLSKKAPRPEPNLKIIWTFWASGKESLPPFVRLCLESWRVHHPGWQLMVLSLDNIADFLSPSTHLAKQFFAIGRASLQADIARLAILAQYGGVYIDITCLCFSDCGERAWQQLQAGQYDYIGYHGRQYGQECLVWFMAVRAHNPLIERWSSALNALFEHRTSDAEVHRDDFFDGISLECFVSAAEDNRDYLVINAAMTAVLAKDPALGCYWRERALLEEGNAAPSAWYEPSFWAPFAPSLHTTVKALATMPFFDMADVVIPPLLVASHERSVDLQRRFMATDPPFIKFVQAGKHFKNLTRSSLMQDASTLALLVQAALG